MLLRNLFEDIGPVADAAFAFGRFNPAHQGHIEVYKAVQNAGRKWYIGTNPNTQGPNDPLSFEQKSAWMQAIYPAIQGHLLPQQSVVTLASKLYELLPEGSTIAYVTDSKDWEWAGKLLNDYNGKEGPHGYYKFKAIKHVESPRVSSATALRTAARANDEAAFYAASGTDPKLTVGGKTYFETVVDAVGAHPEKVKKVAKKKEQGVTESLGTMPTTEYVKGIYAAAAENGMGAPDVEAVRKQMVLAANGEVDIMATMQKAFRVFQDPKFKQMLVDLDALIKQAERGQGVAEVSKSTLDRYVTKAVDAHGHADFAARQSKNDPSKRSYHVDQKKTAEKRRQGISRALDRMSKESVDLKTSLQELSNDMLGKYKKAAGADASKADKEGNFKRGDKRFSGIVKATNKQFANDAKKTK
jgi:hypothetical protein